MRGLFQLPKILAQPCHCGRRVKNDLRPIQSETASAFWKVAIVADVNSYFAHRSFENGISQIAWLKIEFFPEAWQAMGNVVFAIFAQVLSIRINHRRRIIVDPRQIDLIDRHHQDHTQALRRLAHQLRGWPIRDFFCGIVPASFLLGTEVGAIKYFLVAEDLHPFFRCTLG